MQTLAKLRVRYTIVIENDLDRAPGWGNKEEDWVKHFTKHLQESNTHYYPEVLEIKTRLADSWWESGNLIPVINSEGYASLTPEERSIVDINLAGTVEKSHTIQEPSWKKEDE